MSQSSEEENKAQEDTDETPVNIKNGNGEDKHDEEPIALDPESKIASLEEELGQFKDRYMRAVAELENVRRRSEKERSDLLKYGLESAFKDLLPVLDSFEQAVGAEDPSMESAENNKSFFSGMVMVKKQLLDTLKKHGLEQIDAKDQPFDPNFHQAIQRVESAEHKEETVAGEFQKGYTLNGRLIRPAMVSVFIPV